MTVDRNYLLSDQYKDGANLNARFELHRRFSANRYGWHRWVLDQFSLPPLPPAPTILEVGTGPGWLWRENADRIPGDWQITLSDFSSGMVAEAKQGVSVIPHEFSVETFDAQSIPFPDQHFDVVIANHMLYHVPNLDLAISEFFRVLKPTGRLYTATNGTGHLKELRDLESVVKSHSELWQGFAIPKSFTLENGAESLNRHFSHIDLRIYPDSLLVTETEPIIAYILSGLGRQVLTAEETQRLRQHVDAHLAQNQSIYISKEQGLFVATKS